MRKLTRELSNIRNTLLIKLRKDNPKLTLTEIGSIFGITVSTVHEILKGRRKHKSK